MLLTRIREGDKKAPTPGTEVQLSATPGEWAAIMKGMLQLLIQYGVLGVEDNVLVALEEALEAGVKLQKDHSVLLDKSSKASTHSHIRYLLGTINSKAYTPHAQVSMYRALEELRQTLQIQVKDDFVRRMS